MRRYINLGEFPLNTWRVKLARLHANGDVTAHYFTIRYDNSSIQDVAALNAEWMVRYHAE